MEQKIGNKRWLVIALLVICYTFMYFGRSAVSIAGPAMMESNNWNATQFGLVSTAFFIGYAMTMLPAGALADRFGATKVIVAGTLFWSIFTFFSPFGGTIGAFMFIRVLVGMGQGVTLPSASSLVSKWVPKKEAGLAQGLTLVGVPLGTALTMLVGVQLIKYFSWQTIFYSFAFLGPIWTVIWLLFGKDRPELDPKISKSELDYIKSDQGSNPGASQGVSLSNNDIFKNKSVWGATIAYFCYNYVFYLLLTWLPTYLVLGRGFTLVKSGYFTMIPYIVAIFTYPLGGVLADLASKKYGQNVGRKMFPIIGLVVGGCALFVGAQASSAGMAIVLIAASMGFLTLTQGGFFSMPIIFAPRNAGKIVGLYGFIGTFAGISAPLLTGLVVDSYGYNYALFLGAGMALLGAVFLLTICKVKPIEPQI
ncbi:MFS transporter [Dehalobacterium formicoaceticum]|uniref:MFS transporter n=1 Tax=Dehalobacterium formicoaceticum TaxID=51515 RepID=A0ABT1Y697_9FIRM|nr:MFS transporter [Dehalobacterium formicoaceticum]MCR6546387.1 MFS transporter [Dehalobacterium formicoaceticum]